MKMLVLKVDVDTYRGTLEGVPALLRLLDRYGLRATFLFSLGPDHTGRAIRRIFRPGFLSKVRRTSVVSHYGLLTMLYGVLLPGPHIGRRLSGVLRQVRAAGHETGIHCYDHVRWQDFVADKGARWTAREMNRAREAFVAAVEAAPATIGAAGWQINPSVIELEQQMGFRYASDVRGNAPFLPVMEGVPSRCVQLPTTLPTLDELLGVDDLDLSNVADFLLRQTESRTGCQVYTLHAELEGMKMLPVMESLLTGWLDQGFHLGTMADGYRTLDVARLPHREIVWAQVPGRSGRLACEGRLVSSSAIQEVAGI